VVWQYAADGVIESVPHCMGFAVRPDGSVEGMHRATEREGPQRPEENLSKSRQNILVFMTFFAGLATTFVHCKNVKTIEHQPSRQQRRFRERKGGPPLVSWRTIDVPAVDRLLREEGGLGQHGLKKALHLVRGNFATYTEDAPLFGRYTGTFYRPQHVRGKDKGRLSVHDYRVHGPKRKG
jgi:hypothetical protein